jgi:hypothetical protein
LSALDIHETRLRLQRLPESSEKTATQEQLDEAKKRLKTKLLAFRRYRQGFYTHVAIGELGVSELAAVGDRRTHEFQFRLTRGRKGLGGGGAGAVGGFIGLLQQLQQIRNAEDSLKLQERTLAQLVALEEIDMIDLVQVDRFRQSVESERAKLLQNRNGFEQLLDSYKTATLGLPPDLPIQLDDSLIRQFQLVGREATVVQDSLVELQDRVGTLPDDAGAQSVRQILTDISKLVEPARRQLDLAQADLARMDQLVPERERSMTAKESLQFQRDREQQGKTLADLELRFGEAVAELEKLQEGLSGETRVATARRLVYWLDDFLRLVQRSILVQTRARLETVTVETVELSSQDALGIALTNRDDIMAARAELVSRSRDIAALRDELDLDPDATSADPMTTSRFRQALIDYQREHRQFLQALDRVHCGLRQNLRSLEELRVNLEIQRRAVAVALRQVDVTRAMLFAPVAPPAPGGRAAPFGSTAARDTREAQSTLRNTQNNFMCVWLNYLATRLVLFRDLGIMILDEEGRRVDTPFPDLEGRESEKLPSEAPD